jgi:hypothetical protein
VTLATPFIHARQRALSGWWPVFVLAVAGFAVTAWAAVALAEGPHWSDWPVLVLGALVASDTLACIGGACMHPAFRWRGSLRWLGRRLIANPESLPEDVLGAVLRGEFIRPGYRSQLITSVHSPKVEPEDLFVVRAAGDEASMSLAVGQFLGWISAKLNPLLTNMWLWYVILFPVPALAAAVLIHIAIPRFVLRAIIYLCVYLLVVVGLLAVFVVSVMLLAGVPFGWDGPFLSLFASCSPEAAPPGQATIVQLEPFAGAEKRGLAHSRLYLSQPVISKIVTLICGSPG